MIEHYLKTFSIKPRIGVKEYCIYTSAAKESCNLRTTHSSFWLLVNKNKLQTELKHSVINSSEINTEEIVLKEAIINQKQNVQLLNEVINKEKIELKALQEEEK